MFDRLLLLEKGGKTLYFGDIGHHAHTLTGYFERNGARCREPGENPAEWVLDVTGGQHTSKSRIDWHATWQSSPERYEIHHQISEMKGLETASTPLEAVRLPQRPHAEFSASWRSQLFLVTYRAFQDYWRDPIYVYSQVALCVGAVSFLFYL